MQFAKIETDMWSDPDFESLSKDTKLLWIYFLSNSRNNFAGIYEISEKRIKLETEIENLEEVLEELTNTLPIVYDYPTHTVWIKNFLSKYSPNEKQLKGVGKFLDKVKNPSLVGDFLDYNDTLDIPYEYPMDRVGVDKDKDKDKEYNGEEETSPPYQKIINYLNEKADRNFKPSTDKTRKKIKARFNNGFELKDFKNVIDTKVADWKKDEEMQKYLRPRTLFSNKFEDYLNEEIPSGNGKDNNGGRPSQVTEADRKAMEKTRQRMKNNE